jgi:hypothetical protein
MCVYPRLLPVDGNNSRESAALPLQASLGADGEQATGFR